jgi:hypothetical protein
MSRPGLLPKSAPGEPVRETSPAQRAFVHANQAQRMAKKFFFG